MGICCISATVLVDKQGRRVMSECWTCGQPEGCWGELDKAKQRIAELEAELKALREQVRWVPVGDGNRIPEGILVMFFHNDWGTSIGYWHGIGRTSVGLLADILPTHWMPLPPPPQEQDK
jgi:hypothetical protein